MTEIIRLARGAIEVEIWTLGARLNGIWFDDIGNLTDGSETPDEARGSKKYNGAVVGPVANRIAGAQAEIGGRSCTFEANERDRTTLHGGDTGVHAREWAIEALDQTFVSMRLALPDGDGGFPGNRVLTCNYELVDDGLRVQFTAETDALTWINLALHPYWTLGLKGRAGQRLSVTADSYLPVDAYQIPTGEVADVSGTIFDLRTLAVPSFDIDHNFCLNAGDGPAVIMESDAGIRMSVTTDAPGLQVFTGKDIGIAIEPQHWPDAMHHAQFPSIELRPGETFQQNSTYRFSRL